MNQDGNGRELEPEEVALIEHAKRLMQQDLNKVHIRGQLTNYWGDSSSSAFMVATAAYSIGNVLVALEGMSDEMPKMKKLILEAVASIKALHLGMRMGVVDEQPGTVQLPGEPPRK